MLTPHPRRSLARPPLHQNLIDPARQIRPREHPDARARARCRPPRDALAEHGAAPTTAPSAIVAPGATMQSLSWAPAPTVDAVEHDGALDARVRRRPRRSSPSTTSAPTWAPAAIAQPRRRRPAGRCGRRRHVLGDGQEAGAERLGHAGAHVALEDVEGPLQVALGRADVHPVGALGVDGRSSPSPTSAGQISRSMETLRPDGIMSRTARSST